MQYREIPKTKDKLSLLGYGCMRFPTKFGREFSSLINTEKAKAQIFAAIERGVNYFDTAYPYHLGSSESFLGEHILSSHYRKKINIATKLPCWLIKEKDEMEKIFNRQREKLKVDVIDYYLLHAIDGRSFRHMISLGVIEFMEKLKKEGRIRGMGFSFHGRREEFPQIVDAYDWDFAQVQFNILDEHFQAGIDGIKYAAAKGLGIIVMEPLRGGSLSGRIPSEVRRIYDTSEIKREPADWALRWVMNHKEVTSVLSGMNSEEQVEQNCRTADDAYGDSMTEQENEIIGTVRDAYEKLLAVKCTECGYCLPCPAGINIPAVFKNFNNYKMFSRTSARVHHMIYAGFRTSDGKAHWAGSCIGCGGCESRCPQNLPIREHLKLVKDKMEGPFEKTGAAIVRAFSPQK